MSSSASRQAALKKRREAEGIVQVAGWVPAEHAAAVTLFMKRLREDRALEPGPLRNTVTGRLEKLDR